MVGAESVAFAVAGGVFGASIGALNAFAFTGFLVVAGETVRIANAAAEVDITGEVAFGAFLGPHVAFAGGAGAVAYAAKRGYVEGDDGGYHPAKNILEGLGTRPDVLAVGGAFGLVGFLFAEASSAFSAPYDPVAGGVVASALVHRVSLGYTAFGVRKRLEGERNETWLPYQSSPVGVGILGACVGVLGAYTAYVTGSAFLAFGVSAATLALMCAGVDRIPVTHHITLPASTAVVSLTGVSSGNVAVGTVQRLGAEEVILAGILFGVLGAVLGEAAQRALYAGAETHLDPPAVSIVLTTFAIAALHLVGVLPSSSWVPA
jgi:hypothetical protein